MVGGLTIYIYIYIHVSALRRPSTNNLSGGLPTFTKGGTKHVFSPSRRRWMTAFEKLGAMGFPITQDKLFVKHVQT